MITYIAMSYIIMTFISANEYIMEPADIWRTARVFVFAPVALPIILFALLVDWLFSY